MVNMAIKLAEGTGKGTFTKSKRLTFSIERYTVRRVESAGPRALQKSFFSSSALVAAIVFGALLVPASGAFGNTEVQKQQFNKPIKAGKSFNRLTPADKASESGKLSGEDRPGRREIDRKSFV